MLEALWVIPAIIAAVLFVGLGGALMDRGAARHGHKPCRTCRGTGWDYRPPKE